MDLNLSTKTRLIIFGIALMITLVIIPNIQKHSINEWMNKTQIEETGSSEIEIALIGSQNKTNAFLGIFIINLIINVFDGLLLGGVATFLYTISLSFSETDRRTGIEKNNSLKVFLFTSGITFICLFAAFSDIYEAGLDMSGGFGNLLDMLFLF